jgi:hypothetical protein
VVDVVDYHGLRTLVVEAVVVAKGSPACYRCGEQPCVCRDGITLYHGDARDVLPLLEKEVLF